MSSKDSRGDSPRRQRAARKPRAPRILPWFEALEERLLLPGQYIDHLSSDLVALYDSRSSSDNLSATSASQSSTSLTSFQEGLISYDSQGDVGVNITAQDVNAILPALEGTYGFQLAASLPIDHLVSGYLPVGQLANVTNLVPQGLLGVVADYKPITAQVGTFNDQAVNVLEADRVAATPPSNITGTGFTVGVLSNSFNALGGASTDEADGNLPATVKVIQDTTSPGVDDEGRAMLQLVHHTAPGAYESFAASTTFDSVFASNIQALANAGAKVIADDVVLPDEPMFQDGVIAQAIDNVVTNDGVSYFAAAGNYDTQAYLNTSPSFVSTGSGTYLNFTPGSGTNLAQGFLLSSGQAVDLTLEWDSPFYTASGVKTSLSIYIVNTSTNAVVASSTTDATMTQAPLQMVDVKNNGSSTANLAVVIQLAKGPAPGALKYVNYGSNG